ncbi:MAG: metal-dependent transcriptional regulator [Candidatus Coproplasma sp.]
MDRIRESEEMYLETILLLQDKKQGVRAVDVCEGLGYAKSSVSRGINLLKAKGYITVDDNSGIIEFTADGRKKAENVFERHRVLTAALMKIGADRELAEADACRIEHVVSEETMALFKKFIDD